MITKAVVEERLRALLAPVFLKVVDNSGGCGAAFHAYIVSQQFSGKRLLERHRLVNGAIAEEMPHIHAFTMQCLTPDEWEAKDRPES
ncbi:BolA-like protein, putative [Babesia bigemina]|uniref:BolA-like protein, putative n=1 Tax=Babesia bigemina TaxID=5866 RepID=A0A061D322_BABBI|nr:BolA-like protein, putative [Babesia bigemina]CDR95166.1 BolA-like protein, putative [Babesia bigemina]|eukprot:XP_012767352.1 BolA-like protein, putative [Babesia bigemina]